LRRVEGGVDLGLFEGGGEIQELLLFDFLETLQVLDAGDDAGKLGRILLEFTQLRFQNLLLCFQGGQVRELRVQILLSPAATSCALFRQCQQHRVLPDQLLALFLGFVEMPPVRSHETVPGGEFGKQALVALA